MSQPRLPTQGDRRSCRLLVVEDDDAMRELLLEEMSEAGYRTVSVAGGRQAIERARAEPFDLVVTDLRMPDLDGFDLIRDLKAAPSSPHIVMITAFGSIETAIKAVKLGAYDYITKPFDIEELILVADKALKERHLRQQVARLQREVEVKYDFGNIIAQSEEMQNVLSLVKRIADSEVSVLVTGESGTGKELIARAIHYNSPRADKAFIAVNLAAIPSGLIESELFGHKKGAFTDASADRTGLFGEADGGTIFLDEIGELALELQAKLLRVLQEQEFRPVGSSALEKINVRAVAATNRDLHDMMRQGQFREDLYYRLNVIDIHLPPLRARPDDILVIAEHFLRTIAKKRGAAKPHTLSVDAQRSLLGYRWPGNVRELQNVIERGVALAAGDTIEADDFPQQVHYEKHSGYLTAAVAKRLSAAELEREYIEAVLEDESGNKTRTAQRLGFDRKTLYRKLDEYTKIDAKSSRAKDED